MHVIDDETVESIARRVVQLLRTELDDSAVRRLVSASVIAERFDVSRQWVYENANRLGAVRLGTGARPRLRFDPVLVASLLEGRAESETGTARGESERPRADRVDLIPLRGL